MPSHVAWKSPAQLRQQLLAENVHLVVQIWGIRRAFVIPVT